MTIEQTLMRFMKSVGGVTRGRGETDNVLTKWTLGLSIMQQVSESVGEFANVFSTEQHVDARPSRQMRDDVDCKKLMQWFSEHPPFSLLDKIVSLSTGIVPDSTINCLKPHKLNSKRCRTWIIRKFLTSNFFAKIECFP
ncbi:hypothetical protein JTB14_013247 [Gonioctena quinquepunctata]|nr:hypothetical protein JTB14_013247 [Gonioctena quinquepunctata]